jgi:hypothetical protein
VAPRYEFLRFHQILWFYGRVCPGILVLEGGISRAVAATWRIRRCRAGDIPYSAR